MLRNIGDIYIYIYTLRIIEEIVNSSHVRSACPDPRGPGLF